MRRLVAAAVISLFANSASANNLGVAGRVYDIIEPDFRAVIGQQLARADVKKLSEERAPGAFDRYMTHLPNYGLLSATKNVVRDVDVTQVLARDIWVPQLGADEKIHHVLVGRKGQRLDPFATGIVPKSSFLFFDATDPKQVQFARDVHKWTPLVYLVQTKGDPRILAGELNFPVDYLKPELIDMFKLKAVPAFGWAEKNPETKKVSVKLFEMAQPLDLAAVQSKWKPKIAGDMGLTKFKEVENAAKAQAGNVSADSLRHK